MKHIFLIFPIFLLLSFNTTAQVFDIIPLGCSGGINDDNLSAWLVKASGSNRYLCLDAGTLSHGIKLAANNGHLPEAIAADTVTPLVWMLRYGIGAYLISHAHFDHIAGLVTISPDDTPKSIYSSHSTATILTQHVFNNAVWANFTDQGQPPRIGRYQLKELTGDQFEPIEGTQYKVMYFPLSHANIRSSAFLIKYTDRYILYLGDTGADEVEKGQNLQNLWLKIAPLISNQQLEAIIIEASYPDPRPDALLFGHLTPSLLKKEIEKLRSAIGSNDAVQILSKVLFIITHVKPVGGNLNTEIIKKQLEEYDIRGFRFIMAEQGALYRNDYFKK
ncbi:MAG: hypothetical protein A2X11_03040 [Bacteroidetes bacterium GWE2_42_24]|nr:MAG: hypothetical protein A2X11_03040 [Bacteroidetes bacterium GWE2_42_24]OFY28418.1 MAG: hypothetical protein A2X09_14995 [Bacteroidetes bacterium GWF2_43_11]